MRNVILMAAPVWLVVFFSGHPAVKYVQREPRVYQKPSYCRCCPSQSGEIYARPLHCLDSINDKPFMVLEKEAVWRVKYFKNDESIFN